MIAGKNTDETREDKPFSDRYDIARFLADIKLRLRRDISTDFVLAKFDAKNKEGVIEMTSNAYFAKKLIQLLKRRGYVWKWNAEKGEYNKEELSKKDSDYLTKLGDGIFDAFMTRIYMTTILNRNVDGNYLINVLAGYTEKEENVELSQDEISGAMKELTKNEETKKSKEK